MALSAKRATAIISGVFATMAACSQTVQAETVNYRCTTMMKNGPEPITILVDESARSVTIQFTNDRHIFREGIIGRISKDPESATGLQFVRVMDTHYEWGVQGYFYDLDRDTGISTANNKLWRCAVTK